MAWGIDVPVNELVQKLVETRLRIARVKLVQRLQRLNEQAQRQGLSLEGFKDLKNGLERTIPLAPDRVDRALVLPRKSTGVWRRRYLSVKPKPGSVF